MRWKRVLWGMGLCLAAGSSPAWAADAASAPAWPVPGTIVSMQAPAAQPGGQQPGAQAPAESLIPPTTAPTAPETAPSAPEAGTEAAGTATPNMLGDFLEVPRVRGGNHGLALRRPSPARQLAPSGLSSSSEDNDEDEASGTATFLARGAFKITDDESPRPQDRFFLRYNYFNNISDASLPPGFSREDVHREVVGFEKTFLDGNASIGMRLPFVELQGDPSIRKNGVGDLSTILKYAICNDRQTGNVLSLGVVVTAPTGADFEAVGAQRIHDTLIQPYLGGIYNAGKFYVQGFSSVLVPTKEDDITLLFNDLAVGYWLYRCDGNDNMLNFIAPTVETHVTTPLNHRGSTSGIVGLPDIVDLTGGVTLGLCGRSTLTLGFVMPVTGPRPFDYETQAYLNFKF